MKIVSQILSISLLSWVGATFASPPADQGRGLRNDARAMQFEQIAEQRARARAERDMQRDAREANAREGADATQENGGPPRPDEVRKPSRLNPDQRRALRQQINDAGHDIYTPPRQ